MTRLKHTPGPWEAHDNGLIYGPPVDDSDEAAFVADVIADEGARIFGFFSDIEMANAYLIAAAPDLLEALEMAVQALNTAPRFKVPQLACDSYRIATICDAALAKARGGAA